MDNAAKLKFALRYGMSPVKVFQTFGISITACSYSDITVAEEKDRGAIIKWRM